MLKYISLIIIVCVVFISCGNNEKPKKPDNLISKDDMTNILYDLYVVNAAKGVNRKLLENSGFLPETFVLTKYNIDSIQFVNSNNYYAFDTEEYKSIVDKVKERLEGERDNYVELEKKEGREAKRKRDSIKNAFKNKEPMKVQKQKRLILIDSNAN